MSFEGIFLFVLRVHRTQILLLRCIQTRQTSVLLWRSKRFNYVMVCGLLWTQ